MFKIVMMAFVKPGRAISKLLAGKHPLFRSLIAVAAIGFMFAAVSLVLAAEGAVPLADTYLPFSAGNYYFWQMILALPLTATLWLTCGLLIRVTAGPAAGRKGDMKDIMAAVGPALVVPLIAAWLPSAIEAGFMLLGMGQQEFVDITSDPGPWQTVYIALYVLAAVLAVATFFSAARSATKAGRFRAAVSGFLTAVFMVAAFAAVMR